VGLVKENQDRHDFAFRESATTQALDLSAVEQHLFPLFGKGQPEIIDTAKQFE
jgi:hypothetical protein